MGAGFVIAPNILLGVFGLPETSEVWIRVVGMLALLLAFYYMQAARFEMDRFIQWTVYARAAAFVFFVAFALTGLASPIVILFGVVDLLFALWTAWALRTEKRHSLLVSGAVAK